MKPLIVEEFLCNYPVIFFSLPDTWQIWKSAGGAGLGLDHPEKTIPLVKHYCYTADAKKILDDIKACADADNGKKTKTLHDKE